MPSILDILQKPLNITFRFNRVRQLKGFFLSSSWALIYPRTFTLRLSRGATISFPAAIWICKPTVVRFLSVYLCVWGEVRCGGFKEDGPIATMGRIQLASWNELTKRHRNYSRMLSTDQPLLYNPLTTYHIPLTPPLLKKERGRGGEQSKQNGAHTCTKKDRAFSNRQENNYL